MFKIYLKVANMKLAIIGSRSLTAVNLDEYISGEVEELVSGGAVGIDSLVREYAKSRSKPLVEFLPDYKRYGRAAPLIRNREIAEYAEEAIAFWDGKSRGTMHTVDLFRSLGKQVHVVTICD